MSYPNGPSPEDPYDRQGQEPSGGHPAPDQFGGHATPPPGPYGDPRQGHQQPGPQHPHDPSGHQSGGYPPPQGYGGYSPHPGYAPQPSSATTGQANQDERTMALLSHLSGIVLGFIGPLIFFLIKKDESPFVRDQAAQALNFQILMVIGHFVSIVLYIVLIGVFLQLIIVVVTLIFCILAGVAANRGEWYRYPFNVHWVK